MKSNEFRVHNIIPLGIKQASPCLRELVGVSMDTKSCLFLFPLMIRLVGDLIGDILAGGLLEETSGLVGLRIG